MKYEELTAPRLAALDRERTLVILPIAAVEQHGPHMPAGTDTILCGSLCSALEQRLPDRILTLPVLWQGASSHHLRFGATLDSALDHYIANLCDLGRSLIGDGFQRLLFLNGHGGNIDPMRVAVRILQPSSPRVLLAAACYWDAINLRAEDSILEGDHRFVGHACEFETSLMLHLRPELVDLKEAVSAGELIPDSLDGVYLSRDMKQRTARGCTGRPDLATAEKGARLFAMIVQNLVAISEKLLAEPLGTEYRDFTRP